MSEHHNIYVKLKYVNINKNSGWFKYLSGIRQCFELYLGKTEEDASLYMTSTLLDERGMGRRRRNIEAVMHDGEKYNISTQNVPGKTFWQDTSTHTGNITHNEIEIAKINFDGFYDKHWQANISLNSGEKFNIFPYQKKSSFWDIHEMVYGNPKMVRVEGGEILLMEIDEPQRYHIKRPTKVGYIQTVEIRPELLFVLPLYYYVIYPDYIEDHGVTT